MAKECIVCGKKPTVGNSISHADNRNKRRFLPNLQTIRVMDDGEIKKVKVCAKCLKAGKIEKYVKV